MEFSSPLSATPPTGAEGIEKYLASGQMRGIVRRCRNGSLRPLVRLPRHARPEPPLYGRDARQAPCGSRGPEARHRHCSAGWADEAALDKASRMALVTESVTGIPSARLREPTKWSLGRAVPVGGRRLYGDAWRKAERHDGLVIPALLGMLVGSRSGALVLSGRLLGFVSDEGLIATQWRDQWSRLVDAPCF